MFRMKKKSYFNFIYKKLIISFIISVIICSVATYLLHKKILEDEMSESAAWSYGYLSEYDLSGFDNMEDEESAYKRNFMLSYINNYGKKGGVIVNNCTREIVSPLKDIAIIYNGDICVTCDISYFENIDYKKDYRFVARDYYYNGKDFLPGIIEVYPVDKNTSKIYLIETIDLTPENTDGYTHVTKGGWISFVLAGSYPEKVINDELFFDYNYKSAHYIYNASTYYKPDKGFMKYNCYEYVIKDSYMQTYEFIYNYKVNVWNLGKKYFIPLYIGFALGSIIISAFIALLDFKRYEKMRYQRTLTSSLAHDLKSPLMVISGCVENITENVNPEKNDKYIKGIGHNVNHMNDIILNIMELNEIQNDKKVKIKRENCDVKSVFEDLFARNKELMVERNIKYNITGSLVVKCNKSAFSRAIENLINNAIVHSEDGKNIEVILEKNEILIKNSYNNDITYSGKQLVEPFVKGDDSRGNTGTGLGLSIAKSIMDMHKFKMKINMENNVFEVRIKV